MTTTDEGIRLGTMHCTQLCKMAIAGGDGVWSNKSANIWLDNYTRDLQKACDVGQISEQDRACAVKCLEDYVSQMNAAPLYQKPRLADSANNWAEALTANPQDAMERPRNIEESKIGFVAKVRSCIGSVLLFLTILTIAVIFSAALIAE